MAREVRDARLLLPTAAKRQAEAQEAAERRAMLLTLRMRSEVLGTDRWGRRYWSLGEQRVWVQPCTPALATGEAEEAWQLFEGVEACDGIAKSLDLRGQCERALSFSLRRAANHMRRDESDSRLRATTA
jgi:hypothetical protein